MKRADLAGRKFGRLLVISYSGEVVMPSKQKHHTWHCLCDCGNEKTIRAPHLLSGHTTSCGCWQIENRVKHGHTNTPEFLSWKSMVSRCTCQASISWPNYGGRGIKICDRWMDFENFLADMGNRPAGSSIDRIDNDGNYEPENCRWATRIEQGINRRTNTLIELNGVSKSLSEWERETGILSETIKQRICLGWSAKDALTRPVRTQRNNRSAT